MLLSGVGVALRVPPSQGDSTKRHSSTRVDRDTVTSDGLRCSRFEWNSDANSDKAVMRVPISLDGKAFWYQLDTGADVVIPYGSPEHQGWAPRGEAVRIPNVHFAGMVFPSILGYPMKEMPDSPRPQDLHGTVGLDLLIGHALVIDFPKQRICLMERADLPESLTRQADWTDAEVRHGKLFVHINLNGKELDGVFYDTGSSPDALALDLSLWKEATAKSAAKDTTKHVTAQSWGSEVESVSAPSVGDLKIGNHVYRQPSATTMPAQPDIFRDKYGAQGILGNALFGKSTIILDLGSHPSFGIVDPQ
jgi:hypothetical protein